MTPPGSIQIRRDQRDPDEDASSRQAICKIKFGFGVSEDLVDLESGLDRMLDATIVPPGDGPRI